MERGNKPVSISLEALYATKVVSLDEFQRLLFSGEIDKSKTMSDAEKIQQFGSTVVPIFVPLAPGETEQEYERRFQQFLFRRREMSLSELQATSKNRTSERHYRIKFAAANARGYECFRAEHLPSERDEEVYRGEADLAACQACQCCQCLRRAMQLMAERVTLLEKRSNSSGRSSSSAVQRLWQVYDAINEQILINENTLTASTAALASEPFSDIGDTTRLFDENQELEELVREEHGRRNAALAMVVLHMWRFKPDELKRMVHDEAASDVLHIQRTSHHAMAKIAAELTSTQSATNVDELQSKIQLLETARTNHVAVLIHFDRHLREQLGSLLERVDVSKK